MIYSNVKKVADEKGLSIYEVEKRAELPNGTIGKWRTAVPRVDNLKKVAAVLGVKIDLLVRE